MAFEQPDEALEVHPIAEVLNRIRVGDDFGLTKAGIVFQFNAGDEQTLVARDFKIGAGPSPRPRRPSRRCCSWRSLPLRRRTA